MRYYREQVYLAHHGILGQKWGVRRYQNKDGTLTEEGRKHYGSQLAKDAYKYDKKYGKNDRASTIAINRKVRQNKAIKDFNEHSPEYHELKNVNNRLKEISDYSDKINKTLIKKYGEPLKLLNDDLDGFHKYMAEGNDMMKQYLKEKGYENIESEYRKASSNYELAGRKFLDNYLGEYGSKESVSAMRITYNTQTKEIGRQIMKDIIGLEMLRNANGYI